MITKFITVKQKIYKKFKYRNIFGNLSNILLIRLCFIDQSVI